MKLTTFFISRTKQIYTKTSAFSESAFKMKIMSAWTLELLLMSVWSVVIFKQSFLDQNKIVQYLQNYKFQEASPNAMKIP